MRTTSDYFSAQLRQSSLGSNWYSMMQNKALISISRLFERRFNHFDCLILVFLFYFCALIYLKLYRIENNLSLCIEIYQLAILLYCHCSSGSSSIVLIASWIFHEQLQAFARAVIKVSRWITSHFKGVNLFDLLNYESLLELPPVQWMINNFTVGRHYDR